MQFLFSSNNREELSSCVRDRWWEMLLERNEKSGSSSQKTKTKTLVSQKTTQRFGEIKWWYLEAKTIFNSHICKSLFNSISYII